jgi:hypothetical protein
MSGRGGGRGGGRGHSNLNLVVEQLHTMINDHVAAAQVQGKVPGGKARCLVTLSNRSFLRYNLNYLYSSVFVISVQVKRAVLLRTSWTVSPILLMGLMGQSTFSGGLRKSNQCFPCVIVLLRTK